MQKVSGITNSFPIPTGLNSWYVKLAVLACLISLADWLFYGQAFGITLPIFIALLAAGNFFVEKPNATIKTSRINLFLLIASLLPLIEELNTLTFIVGCAGILNFTFSMKEKTSKSLLEKTSLAVLFILRMPFKLLFDGFRFASVRKRMKTVHSSQAFLGNWLVPILMTSGFLFLFAIANPLIGNWITALDLGFLLSLINMDRIIFWGFIAIVSWSFLKPSYQKLCNTLSRIGLKKRQTSIQHKPENGILNEMTVFRSLVLFNILFALQTALDFQYLWIGSSLPSGVTFSEYVHNGTYILIFTTLLAASFILFVTSKKKRLEKSPRIMGLLLAWISQNIILVLSNVMRMELYVEAFALTYLRLGVLIWLTLVVIGLVFMIVRLYKGLSNGWLIKANLISLAITLYATSFANLPYLISDYNLRVAEQNSSKRLDIHYIVALGPNTIPVLDRIIASPRWEKDVKSKVYWDGSNRDRRDLIEVRNRFVVKASHQYSDWRQWNFRDFRLQSAINQFQPTVLP